jgi:hypothetical protein
MLTDLQSRRARQRQLQARVRLKVDVGLHQHAAKRAVVARAERQRQALEVRAIDLDPYAQLPVEVVLARRCPRSYHEVEVRLVLGHAPDALATLDRDFARNGQVEDVLTGAVQLLRERQRRQQRGRGPCAVGARDRDRELDVAADVRRAIVDDRHHQHCAIAENPQRMDLVARQ